MRVFRDSEVLHRRWWLSFEKIVKIMASYSQIGVRVQIRGL